MLRENGETHCPNGETRRPNGETRRPNGEVRCPNGETEGSNGETCRPLGDGPGNAGDAGGKDGWGDAVDDAAGLPHAGSRCGQTARPAQNERASGSKAALMTPP